jgi:hypothetical protein
MQSRGFDTALDEFGRSGVQAGATNQQLRISAEGVAMHEGGDLGDLNRRFARIGVGERLAHSEVVDLLGRLTGVDTASVEGIKRLSISTEGSRQSVTIEADADARERVIDALQLDDKTAAALRAREGGFRLGVALDADGSVAYGNIETGRQVYLVDRTSVENSFSEVSRSTLELGGGRALFDNPEQFEQQLDRVFEGSTLYTGVVTQRGDAALTAMSKGLSQFMSERGLSLDASSQESVQHTFGAGGSVGVGAPKDLSPVEASASGRFDSSKRESDIRSAGRDLQADYARDALLSARSEAVEAARSRFGTFNDGNEAEVRASILQDMRLRVVDKMSQTRDAALEETAGARAGHDVEPDFAVEQRELRDEMDLRGDLVSTQHGVIKR